MSLLRWVPDIADLVGEFKSRRLLDYGCGLGWQYTRERAHNAWGTEMPVLYDPAVYGREMRPAGPFDGVICTDVLEHVPEDELDAVLRDIAGFAAQWAFISVCCRPSKHIRLPIGGNVHVTVQPIEWWWARLAPFFDGKVRLVLKETK